MPQMALTQGQVRSPSKNTIIGFKIEILTIFRCLSTMATTADLMHLALLRLGRSSTGLRWEIQDLQIYKKNWNFHPALLSNERRCAINEKSSMDSTGKQTTVKGRHT